MLQKFLSLFIIISCISYAIGQPPGDGVDLGIYSDISHTLPTIKCFELSFQSNNHDVINLDCPENTVFNIDVIRNTCGCENFSILIGGKMIKNVSKVELENLTFTKNDLFNFTYLFEETGQTFLTVEIKCVKKISTFEGIEFYSISERISHPIQIVKSGQEYAAEIDHAVHQALAQYQPTSVENDLSICCNSSKTFKITNDVSKITGSSTNSTIEISGSFELNGGPVTFQFPLSTNYSWANFTLNQELDIKEQSITIDGKDNPNGCQQVGYLMKGDIYEMQKFRAVCNLPDIPIGNPWLVLVPKYLEMKVFNVPTKIDCPPIDPIVEPRRNFFNRMACTGSLVLDIENQDDLYISWTDENGQIVESADGNLSNVPLGQYTVTISNQCCDVVTETYYLCESTTESQYEQKSNGEWCRTVTCHGEGCDEAFQECVTPDDIIETYIPSTKQCKKEYFYSNKKIGETISDAEFNTNYDQITKNCIRIYSCGNTVNVESISQPAQFGFWTYNNYNNLCERSVICFNETMPSTVLDTEDPNIVYQNNTSLCIVKCDNFPASSFYPINPGFWQWNPLQGCSKDVTCVATDGSFTVNGIANYSNWRFNSIQQMCESDVYCDNTPVWGATNTTLPESIGSWQYSNTASFSQQCSRTIYCNGTLVTDYSSPTYQNYIDCNCTNGVAFSYDIYCGSQKVDSSPCPSPCFNDGENVDSRNSTNSEINFFPTIVTDEIFFRKLNDALLYNISIKNSFGEIILSQKLNGSVLNVSNLSAGVYFITLQESNKVIFSSKFVKI
ncbi:MAG: T9SS type A sorting domain-containing protein [Saprospiraceae bacterium]